jgi:hypothetical protein
MRRVDHTERGNQAMRTCKLILAALMAILAMALAVTSATAGRLRSSSQTFRIVWAALKFGAIEIGTIDCPVTFEGSFHSTTIRKTTGALIGAVTRSIVKGDSCTGGRATMLAESLPWHVTYETFTGTLPTITSVFLLLRRYALQVETTVVIPLICLYRDQNRPEENQVLKLRVGASGQVTTVTIDPFINRYVSFWSGSVGCPRRATFEEQGELYVLGSSTTRISITLI